MAVVHLTEKNFDQEVVKSNVPVLIDFWAEWCGPCRMVGPVLDEAAKEFEGKIKIAKVNVDEASDLAGRFGIMSIPTLIFFKNGQPIDQIVGAMGREQLFSKIKQNL